MVFVNTVINRILKIIACIILFSFYSFAQEKEVIWENSLEPNIPFTVSMYGKNQGLIQNQIDDIFVKDNNSFLLNTANGVLEFNGIKFNDFFKNKQFKDSKFRKYIFSKKRNSLFAIDNSNLLYEISPSIQHINLNSETIFCSVLNGDTLISASQSGNIYVTNIITKRSKWVHKLKLTRFLSDIHYKNLMSFQFPYLYIIADKGLIKLNVVNRQESMIVKFECTRLEVNPFNKSIYVLSNCGLFKVTPSGYEDCSIKIGTAHKKNIAKYMKIS